MATLKHDRGPSSPHTTTVERVRAAIPWAQEILIGHGIEADPTPDEDDLVGRVARMRGDAAFEQEYAAMSERDTVMWAGRLDSTLALGIALGLLMRPEAFGIGGGR